MRWGFVLVMLLLAPIGTAQPPVADWVSVEIAPFAAPVPPLQSPVTTTFRTSLSCLLATETGVAPVIYTLIEAPKWATVVISPATDAAEATECEEGRLHLEGTITVTANDQAPAFVVLPIVIEARAEARPTPQSGRGTVNLSAGYFSILDVQLEEAQVVVPPGASHDFAVRVTNFGNADTRVEAFLLEAAEGLQVAIPPPVVLQSKQAGGAQIAQDLVFRVTTDAGGGLVNRVGNVNVEIRSSAASDPSLVGDGSTVSFLVTTRTGAKENSSDDRSLPLGWALVPAALAIAARFRGFAKP